MAYQKFNPEKLEKLNDPARAETLIRDLMWKALGVPAATTLVEIGAGTGFFARRFSSLAPQATVHAVDMAQVMIDWMNSNLAEVAEGAIVPLLVDETTIDLADGIADAVYMINLHHELADPEATYREAVRLLKPGGRILVVDWVDRETPRGPRLDIRASTDELKSVLEEAGVSEVEIHEGLPWHHMVTATKPEDV
jgi:ubiquinone/menaquinone biosynthesis C-methylase UbiE